MSENSQQCKSKKSLAAKNDKNMKRYSDSEKTLLYELFERYQEIIDIKLRRNLYSSTKQCEVRECWELILKTFNEHPQTSERTMKQLQKFWLNAKLRRMIPYDKSQNEMNSRRASNDSKSQNKIKQSPQRNEQDNVENIDYEQHEDVSPSKPSGERDEKPQIFNIKYVVPNNLIIQEHQTEHTNESESFQNTTKEIHETPNNEQTDDTDHDHHMQDDSIEEAHEEHENSFTISNQEKIDNLRLQEMEHRVCESQLRCDVQRLMINKAEEEFKHLQEMNKIRLQEAKIRLKLLERSSASDNGARGNDGI